MQKKIILLTNTEFYTKKVTWSIVNTLCIKREWGNGDKGVGGEGKGREGGKPQHSFTVIKISMSKYPLNFTFQMQNIKL